MTSRPKARCWTVIASLLIALGFVAHDRPAVAAGLGPPTVLTPDGCGYGQFTLAPDGVVRGFASCGDATVFYLEQRNGRWVRKATSFEGHVLAAADDGTTSFVLIVMDGDVRVARRTRGGVELGPRSLGRHYAAEGSMVARGGKWWAVWRAYFPPGNEPDHLWQTGTLFGQQPPQQITHSTATDSSPALGIGPRGRLVLTWNRWSNPGAIRIASTADGRWTARQLARTDLAPAEPSLVADPDGVAVAWRDAQKTLVNLVRLPAGGGSFSAQWTTTKVPDHPAIGGRSTAPRFGVSVPAGSSYRQLLVVHRSGSRWISEDATVPGIDYPEWMAVSAVLVRPQGLTVVLAHNRDSDPDPEYAQDASRLIARSR